MKPINLSHSAILLVALTVLLLLAGIWYFGFYGPITDSLEQIQMQSRQTEDTLAAAASRVMALEAMEAELESAPAGSNARIAPFDNKQAVLQSLNQILQDTLEYSLQFQEPSIQEDGIVRRVVVMQVRCSGISQVQAILSALESGPWLCLIQNVSLSGADSIWDGPVQFHATVTYLESTRLK